jgi:Protein of unknown function (DUF1257)
MSHYTTVRTTLRDADVLAEALKEVGFAMVEVNDTPQPLRGFAGRTGAARAELIVRRQDAAGASADIGFARSPDGSFAAVMDSMDLGRYGAQWLRRLTQAYGHMAALRYALAHGYEVLTDESEHDGTRRLTLRRFTG